MKLSPKGQFIVDRWDELELSEPQRDFIIDQVQSTNDKFINEAKTRGEIPKSIKCWIYIRRIPSSEPHKWNIQSYVRVEAYGLC